MMSEKNVEVYDASTYDTIVSEAGNNDSGSRLHAASMIMKRCGDTEMAKTLGILSAQMDFDNNIEACDAINRTRATLDELIRDRRSHCAQTYINHIRDDEVLAMSGGQVTDHDYSDVHSQFLKNGLFDPDIFGGSGKIPYYDDGSDRYDVKDLGNGLGHIELPVHAVLKSDYHTIAGLLHMSDDDVQSIMSYSVYVVLDSGSTDFAVGSLMSEAAYRKHADEDFRVGTGGDAIYELLKNLGYADQPERLAFRMIPVVSPKIRPVNYSRKEKQYYAGNIAGHYDQVITRVTRLNRLMEINAPEVILRNESRVLNEVVNMLVECIDEYRRKFARRLTDKNVGVFYQLSFVCRRRNFAFIKPVTEKTGDIESLGIYPEIILKQNDDGTVEPCSLDDIVTYCQDSMQRFEQAHLTEASFCEDEPIEDESTPEEIAMFEKAEAELSKMSNIIDEIMERAAEQQRKFTVRYDSDMDYYVPCTEA